MEFCDSMTIFGIVSFTLNCLFIIGLCAKKYKADKFDETYHASLFDEGPVPL